MRETRLIGIGTMLIGIGREDRIFRLFLFARICLRQFRHSLVKMENEPFLQFQNGKTADNKTDDSQTCFCCFIVVTGQPYFNITILT